MSDKRHKYKNAEKETFPLDLRIEKTKRNIVNAFLELRAKKPLEKITVKELSEKAEINKATFYLHYHDIYDLSETLERDVVESTIGNIRHPEELFRNNRLFIRELGESFSANEQLIKILFEGSRSSSFVTLFEEELIKFIHTVHPDIQLDLENRMMMTYMIYGGYYTYFKYCDQGFSVVIEVMEKLSGGLMLLCE